MILFIALNWGVRTALSQLPPIFQGPPGLHGSCRSSLTPIGNFSELFDSNSDSLLERKQEKYRNPPVTHPAFTLLSSEYVDDHAMNAAAYVHRTGMRVYSLSSAPSERQMTLSICFKTPTKETYGTAGILAKVVFQGSVRYPVFSLIPKVSEDSLASSFTNKLWPEKTCFYMSTTNIKDFYNLFGVYLDAVFQPLAVRDPLILAQAGWRYELVPRGGRYAIGEEDTDCVASPHLCVLRVAGDGHEEARVNSRAADFFLFQVEAQELFPESELHANFKLGDSKEMTNLSFSYLKQYHETHYTPENGWIVIHGPDDVKARLDFIDDYLNSINAKDAVPRDTRLPAQLRFKAPRYVERPFERSTRALEDFVVVEWVLNPGPSDEFYKKEDEITLRVLGHLLVDMEGAPLAEALKSSGLGKHFRRLCFPFRFSDRVFSVGLSGVEQREGAAQEIEKIVLKALKDLRPFTAGQIQEAIDGAEMSYMTYFRNPDRAGVALARAMDYQIMQNADPLVTLRYSEALRALRRRIANGEKVFENLIQKYLLNNPHRLTLRLKASNTFYEEIEQEEKDFLEAKKNQMTPQQLKAIVDQQEQIWERMNKPPTPQALATLPVLKQEDMNLEMHEIPSTHTSVSGVPLLLFPISRPGFVYFDAAISVSSLSLADLQLVPLLSLMLMEAGTQELVFEQFDSLVKKNTGSLIVIYDFVSNPDTPTTVPNPKDGRGYVFVKAATLKRKLPSVLCLLHMMLLSPSFGNARAGIKIIKRLIEVRENKMRSKPFELASFHSAGRFGAAGLAKEGTRGLSSLSFYKKLLTQAVIDWAPIACRLSSLWNLLLHRNNIIFSVTGDAAALSSVTTEPFLGPLKAFVAALREGRGPSDGFVDKKATEIFRGSKKETEGDPRGLLPKAFTETPLWAREAEEKGLLNPTTRKAYVAPLSASDMCVSLPFASPGTFLSSLRVASAALNDIYFANITREELGMKASWAFLNNEGVLTFVSRDDDNVVDSIMNILGAAAWLKQWARTASEQEFSRVRLSLLKENEKGPCDGMRAKEGLLRMAMGMRKGDVSNYKRNFIQAKREDVLAVAEVFENILKKESPAVTIVGNQGDVLTLQKEGIDLEIVDVKKMYD